jgi:hypothetical protein
MIKIIPMKSKVIADDGKLHPLFAIVDPHGHTIIQVLSMKMAEDLLRDL